MLEIFRDYSCWILNIKNNNNNNNKPLYILAFKLKFRLFSLKSFVYTQNYRTFQLFLLISNLPIYLNFTKVNALKPQFFFQNLQIKHFFQIKILNLTLINTVINWEKYEKLNLKFLDFQNFCFKAKSINRHWWNGYDRAND